MRNIIYLFYFIYSTDYSNLKKSILCASKKGHSKYFLVFDMLRCSLLFGSSFIDYFNFRFYEKSYLARSQYATMGIMYRFHKRINDQSKIYLVDNKLEFDKHFSKFKMKTYNFLNVDINLFFEFINSRVGKTIVIKDIDSTAGKGVYFCDVTSIDGEVFINELHYKIWFEKAFVNQELLYIEDYLEQHEKLQIISPTGLNTVRVITLLENNYVKILGAAFRISVDSKLDNFSAGNLAAAIEISSGRILYGGIRKLAACDQYHEIHPITSARIKDEVIPYWNEVLELVQNAAMVIPAVRSVGWDVAILGNGPFLIEGNSKWNKDTWQIPPNEGRLEMIKNYM